MYHIKQDKARTDLGGAHLHGVKAVLKGKKL